MTSVWVFVFPDTEFSDAREIQLEKLAKKWKVSIVSMETTPEWSCQVEGTQTNVEMLYTDIPWDVQMYDT